MRRWQRVALLMVILGLVVAPLAEAGLVKFKCEGGVEVFEGPGYCLECHYTICCGLFDDGSVECVEHHTCRDCETPAA